MMPERKALHAGRASNGGHYSAKKGVEVGEADKEGGKADGTAVCIKGHHV